MEIELEEELGEQHDINFLDDVEALEGTYPGERRRCDRYFSKRLKLIICFCFVLCFITLLITSITTLFAFTITNRESSDISSSNATSVVDHSSLELNSSFTSYNEPSTLISYGSEEYSSINSYSDPFTSESSEDEEYSSDSSNDESYDTGLPPSALLNLSLNPELFADRMEMVSVVMDSLRDVIVCTANCSTQDSAEYTEVEYTVGTSTCQSDFTLETVVTIKDILSGVYSFDISVDAAAESYDDALNLPLDPASGYEGDQQIWKEKTNCGEDFVRGSIIHDLESIELNKCGALRSYFPLLFPSSTDDYPLQKSTETYWWKLSYDMSLMWKGEEYRAICLFDMEYPNFQSAAEGIITTPSSVVWRFSLENSNNDPLFLINTQDLISAVANVVQQYESSGCNKR